MIEVHRVTANSDTAKFELVPPTQVFDMAVLDPIADEIRLVLVLLNVAVGISERVGVGA